MEIGPKQPRKPRAAGGQNFEKGDLHLTYQTTKNKIFNSVG